MPESRAGSSRVILILGAIATIGFLLGPLGAFLGILPPITAFGLFGLSGLLGVLTFIVSLIIAFRKGLSAAMPGVLIGGLITTAFFFLAFPGRQLPRINDITTDTQHAPEFVQAPSLPGNEGRDMHYPGESFAGQQRAGYPNLKPLQLPDPPAVVFERAARAAGEMPQWEVTRSDAAALALEGFSTSRLFRFKDDFVIEVRPYETGSIVQMRSKSRVGRGDVGANAARIETFFAKLR